MKKTFLMLGTLTVAIAFLLAQPIWSADRSKSAFPRPLKVAALDTKAPSPKLGYVSGSAGGGFTLNGNEGHASFRWNHELEVDWHDHPTTYAAVANDPDGNKYWVYTLKYDHEGHIDKVWIYFAQQKVPSDTGYRIFFGHRDYEKGEQEPEQPLEHDIHVWCTDASQYGYHETTTPEAKKFKFNILSSK